MKLLILVVAMISIMASDYVTACDRSNVSQAATASVINNVTVGGNGSSGSGTGTKFSFSGKRRFISGSIADGQSGSFRPRKKRTRFDVGV